jgi:anti-anti-sigma factor
MESRPVEVEVVSKDGSARILVRGELDLAGAPELDAALASIDGARGSDLVLDLTGVTFIDSSGIRSVLDAYHRSRARGAEMRIISGLEAGIVFQLAGLSGRLPFVTGTDRVT